MLISAVTRFNCGDHVYYRRETHLPWKKGHILAIKCWTVRAFVPGKFMIYYTIEPIELAGFEHDDEELIHEHDDTIRAIT